MSHSLKYAAIHLGLGHRDLMRRMRDAGLLNKSNLPADPEMTKAFLVTRENRFYHPGAGMQYPRTTRVTTDGLHWLATKLGIERPMPEPAPDPRDVE